jgi:ABC-type sugar transport system permease subunit
VTPPQTEGTTTPALPAQQGGEPGVASFGRRTRRRYSLLTRRDKVVLGLMVGFPLILDFAFIWGPAVASFVLSFTNWRGVEPLTAKSFIGLQNYEQLFSGTYPFFWPAVQHNLVWLGFLMFVATPLGILMAVLLDRELRGSRIYQTVFYLPVVLSLAVIGIIWQLQYSADNGFIDVALRGLGVEHPPDWFGDQSIVLVAPVNLWAAMVAASWRHVGYVMIIYLAGLKSVDPGLREAAKVDGASERQTFVHVTFPVMAPINAVIVVITTIEALRAFDLAYIINRGRNGLELLSTLITNNSISESSRVGFGSAIAVVLLVISLGPIIVFLVRTTRAEQS